MAQDGDAPPQLRVAYSDFRPYAFDDKAGEPHGYAVDLLRHLAADNGLALSFVRAPNPGEMLDLLRDGKVDATTLLAITPNRDEIGIFTQAVGSYDTSLFVPQDSPIHSVLDATGLRIGATQGSFSRDAAMTVPFADVVTYQDRRALLFALLEGKVDAVVSPHEAFTAELRNLGLSHRATALNTPLLSRPRAFLVSPDRPDLVAAFDKSLSTLMSSAEARALYMRWFGTPPASNQVNWTMLAVEIAVAIAAALFVLRLIVGEREKREKARQVQARNQLLVDALNGIDLAVVIYDEDMRALHWNDGMIRNFPRMVGALRQGATATELISVSYQNGTTAERMTREDANAFATRVIDNARQGKRQRRLLRMNDGQVFEASEFQVGGNKLASIRTNVTELQRQATEIRVQKEALEQANERLKSFSSIAAHDLSAPLRHQRQLIDFVRDDIAEGGDMSKDLTDDLETIQSSAERMEHLINDLLLYARVENDAEAAVSINVQEHIHEAMRLVAVPSEFHVDIDIAEEMQHATLSPSGFDIVMRNLISNAVHHHDHANGHIYIRGYVEADHMLLEIEDDGPGIPDAFHDRVFHPFERLGTRSSNSGNGLGLSFVRRIVETWGAQISIHPAATRGTLFRIVIPGASATGRPEDQRRASAQ